jgi:hypothetical protein
LLQKAFSQDQVAAQKAEIEISKIIENNSEAMTNYKSAQSKVIDLQKNSIALKNKELELTMKMREGYLDVINEMTTANDLVSSMIPDMNRGMASLANVARDIGKSDIAGSFRYGITDATAGAVSVADAARYNARGLQNTGKLSPTRAKFEKLTTQYHDTNFSGVKQEQARRSDTFGGILPEKQHYRPTLPFADATFAGFRFSGGTVPMYSGGTIPGLPSEVGDNTLGSVRGRKIALNGGEYVVNHRSAKQHRALLDQINANPGVYNASSMESGIMSGDMGGVSGGAGIAGSTVVSGLKIGTLNVNGKAVAQDITSSEKFTLEAMDNKRRLS